MPDKDETSVEIAVERPKRPKGVFWLAMAYIGLGLLSVFETISVFVTANMPVPSINFLMVFIIIGIGLLRGSRLARQFAVGCGLLVSLFYIGAIIFHLQLTRNLDLLMDVIFWLVSGTAVAAGLFSVFILNTEKANDFFHRDDD